MRIISTPRWRK